MPRAVEENMSSPERRNQDVAGLLVFSSIAQALRAGFQVYDRTPDGYLVRVRTQGGWAMAIVRCRE